MRFLAPCLALVLLLALSPIRAQCASNATETVREAINDLLDDFDDFKDSEIFRQCVYGCGSENPGNEWRDRIKTLQRQAMRRKEVPTRLKDAIGELWQMAGPTPEAMPAKQLNCASASRLCWKSKIATTNQANSQKPEPSYFPHRGPQPEKRPYRHPQRNYLASRLI